MATIIQQLEAAEEQEKPYDASDPKAVNEARKREGRSIKKRREAIYDLMKKEEGRALIHDFVKCAYDGSPMVNGDPHSTYFNLGMEWKARALFKDLMKYCPDEVVKMITEANSD